MAKDKTYRQRITGKPPISKKAIRKEKVDVWIKEHLEDLKGKVKKGQGLDDVMKVLGRNGNLASGERSSIPRLIVDGIWEYKNLIYEDVSFSAANFDVDIGKAYDEKRLTDEQYDQSVTRSCHVLSELWAIGIFDRERMKGRFIYTFSNKIKQMGLRWFYESRYMNWKEGEFF